MTKKDFLNALVAGLSRAMGTKEMAELRDYYAEQIDDRVEEGLAEEEAVAALGDPEALAEQLIRENGARDTAPADARDARIEGDIVRLELDVARADVVLRHEQLPEGEAARVKFASKYEWSLTDGTLRIEERDEEKNFFRRLISLPMEITLAKNNIEALDARSLAGDLSLAGIRIRAVTIDTRSGDVTLERIDSAEIAVGCASGDISAKETAADRVCFKCASGDITVKDVRAEALQIQSASGDVELANVSVDRAALSTSSGDCTVRGLKGRMLRLESASGDIDLSNAAIVDALEVESASGDIGLRGVSARQAQLHTRSGDIEGTFKEARGGYRFEANAQRGEARVPRTEGDRLVRVETVSGDIHLEVNA